MTKFSQKITKIFANITSDKSFLSLLHKIENFAAKILSITLSVVMLVAIFDLIIFLGKDIYSDPMGFYNKSIIELFGLFLNILIALELLENITAYLKKHIVQVELVIVTSLIAISRKIIIFDLQKYSSNDLLSLGLATLFLSISYWIIRRLNPRN
ncbi:MAG: phosphate-starvation-inducible PsiE family protein [Pleurocapsa sp.]